ncbi:MAG: hypothetical protein L6R39_004445 [Caloplaca ligustica]|nr:MAG: hypothetical protein L6R39_004445 [Caloplaca ligustica]
MILAVFIYFLIVLYILPATALAKYYSLWPVASDHSDDNDKITEDLTNRVGSDNFMMSKSPTLGVIYWFAKLSDEDVKHYQGVPGIVYVADLAEVNKPDEDALRANFKRRASRTRRSMTSQVPASKHLKTISTAPGQNWEKQDGYHFDDTAGQGTRIYIIDSGLDLTHKEFKDYNPDWMYAGPYAEKSQSDSLKDDTYAPPHGTAMASVAVGIEQGVAKKASLTVVRSDGFTKQDGNGLDRRTFLPETWIDGLKQVYDDIHDKVKNGEDPKAVINMSWGVAKFLQHPEYDDVIHHTFANLLKSIDSLNAVMLAASGQPALFRPTVDTWPQLLAETEVPNLIVVGGIDDDGTRDDSTRDAPFVKVYANSVDVDVADARNGDYRTTDGTSPGEDHFRP